MLKALQNKPIIKNIVYAGLTALVILFALLWWLKYYTNHGEKIETPDFTGLSINDAQKLAKKSNLQLVIDSVYNPNAVKGSVFIQKPSAHTDSTPSWVKPERKIYLTAVRMSVQKLPFPNIDASEMVVIPRLSGKFQINKEYKLGPSGRVLYAELSGKKIQEGDLVPRNAKITLYIGKDDLKQPVSIPNLVGLTINEANLELSVKNLQLVTSNMEGCKTTADSLKAKIVEQDPIFTANGQILEGEPIIVNCSCN